MSISIALATLAFSAVRYGREVHVDDKNEILRQLADCRANCERLSAEVKRLTDSNLDLMQRLLRLNGGPK